MPERWLLATFRTTHAAIAAERAALSAGLRVEMVPVPRELSSDCGFCLRIDADRPPPTITDASTWWHLTIDDKETFYERIP